MNAVAQIVRSRSVGTVRTTAFAAFAASLAVLGGCGGGGDSTASPTGTSGHARLARIEYGRLADVYGLRNTTEGLTFTLYERDVLVGTDIQDERDTGSTKRDDEVTYDFLSADPDTLQPRLFIPRDIESAAFRDAFERLDDEARLVTPMDFGSSNPGQPFPVVPRNAAIRLSFTANLGIDDSFFVQRDASGQVTGLRNTEAVQLLQISGDPTQPNAFRPLPARIVVRQSSMILDPVLLGTEGLQYQTRNSAAGLPESPNQIGANIRVAVELEGPLAIPGLREDENQGFIGLNNAGRRSIVRDFRSGNPADESADIARGFVRDPIPPRIVGEIVMFLERVEPVNRFTQEVTVFKNGVVHEIDRGDVLRFVSDASGVPFAAAEVVADPEDDRGQPGVQHVRVRVRFVENLESIDPWNELQQVPPNERDAWLAANAPKAVLVAEYSAGGDVGGIPGNRVGDDPVYFITFVPNPLPNLDGSFPAPNQFVSPFAGAVIRFTKPVDLTTVKWADTFFFGMRNLLDRAAMDTFVQNVPNGTGTPGMDPSAFDPDKYRTPFLVQARVFDEDGSQTTLRLQPTGGLYVDDTMRNPPAGSDFRYFLHLVATSDGEVTGIRDLAGNALDLQATTPTYAPNIVIPFTVDTRSNGTQPFFENNIVVSLVRRFPSSTRDEDEQPSYHIPDEVQPVSGNPRAAAFALDDVFGSVVFVDGKLQGRPTSRVRKIADNRNQAAVASQASDLRWCPEIVGGEAQIASNSATALFTGGGIQNPLNPYGARLQTVWREIDLSLSRVDPFDFNLDVEQMYWAPFTGGTVTYDEFDRVSLSLGHSERRPEPCVGEFSALATFPNSGLLTSAFADNYVHNMRANATDKESQPDPWLAYDAPLTIDAARTVFEPSGENRFLPLPPFRQPYFVYRDETAIEQGCVTGTGSDVQPPPSSYLPWIISPWLNGMGRRAVQAAPTQVLLLNGFWNNCVNFNFGGGSADVFTDGLVGNIAQPLLADFWIYCDLPTLPAGNGYVALGTNGWQVSVTTASGAQPNFRVLSAGRGAVQSGPAICLNTNDGGWNAPSGGFNLAGAPTARGDNSLYWIMIDFLKRTTVATAGFVDLYNPHRVPEGFADPRIGPYYLRGGIPNPPQDVLPAFSYEFDPPLSQLPGGTSIVPQFRAASAVDTASNGGPWYHANWGNTTLYPVAVRPQLRPDATNFPLDPFKAGDAHIRKFDTRPIPGGQANRNWWTYLYNRTVTGYVTDPNELMDPAFLRRSAGPNEGFLPRDVRYVNWRFLMNNNVEAQPPVSPSIETFALAYRFELQRER